MDKLQPILVYKFWIALGAALILAPVGWWMGTEPLIAELTTRTAAVDAAHKNVEQVAKDANKTANPTWASALGELNAKRHETIDEQFSRLWSEQAAYMTFPEEIQKYLPETYLANFNQLGKTFYPDAYEKELLRVRKIVEPLEPGVEGKIHLATGIPRAPGSPWKDSLIPTSEKIWNAQEDIWLLSSLMEAIARVNQHSRSIVESPIRELRGLRLRGGDRADLDKRRQEKAASTADSQSNAPKAPPKMSRNRGKDDDSDAKSPIQAMMNEASGSSRSQRNDANFSLDFDLNSVFGSRNGDSAVDLSSSNPTPAGADDGAAFQDGMMANKNENRPGDSSSKGPESRYVDEPSETQKYATRGFFIEVIMDLRELPQLQAELISSQFPAEIALVQWAEYRWDGKTPIFRDARESSAAPRSGTPNSPSQQQNPAVAAAASAYRKAMTDPYLAKVSIAGLMTLYRPPTPEAAKLLAKTTRSPGAASPAAEGASGETVAAKTGPESTSAAEGTAAAGSGGQTPAGAELKSTETTTAPEPSANGTAAGDGKPVNSDAKTP